MKEPTFVLTNDGFLFINGLLIGYTYKGENLYFYLKKMWGFHEGNYPKYGFCIWEETEFKFPDFSVEFDKVVDNNHKLNSQEIYDKFDELFDKIQNIIGKYNFTP